MIILTVVHCVQIVGVILGYINYTNIEEYMKLDAKFFF
jgi:hypothetical protein